jgi:hypothetical protein
MQLPTERALEDTFRTNFASGQLLMKIVWTASEYDGVKNMPVKPLHCALGAINFIGSFRLRTLVRVLCFGMAQLPEDP